MTRCIRTLPAIRWPAIATTLVMLSACATAPAGRAFTIGQQVAIDGIVVSVDTAPWAYDGNAVVTLSTTTARGVRVQLPARWNLCKAAPPGDVQALQPGDRVQAIGTATAADELVVCEQPQHLLRALP